MRARCRRAARMVALAAAAGALSVVAACSAPGEGGVPHTATAPAPPPVGGPRTIRLTAPAATRLAITGAVFPARDTGWVVGTAGAQARVLHTSTAGEAWQVQWHGVGHPLSVSAAGPRRAWVLVGCPARARYSCRPRLLGTTDAGQRWQVLTRLPRTVKQVQFVSNTLGVAVTGKACPAAYPPVPCPGRVLVSHDGGDRWTEVLSSPTPVFATANAAGLLWAAQVVGSVTPTGTSVPVATVMTSADGGRTWRRLGPLTGVEPLGDQVRIQLVPGRGGLTWASLFDMGSCAMHGCGVAQLFHSGDGGRTWVSAGLGIKPVSQCGNNGIVYSAAPDGTVWAATGRNGAACSPPFGLLYRHSAAGWQTLRPWQLTSVTIVAAVSSTVAYAGDSNVLARTDDGGRHWTQVLPSASPAGQFAALSASVAVAAGDAADAGAILRTADGGRTWQQVADLPGVLTQVDFPSPGQGVAVTFQSGRRPFWQLWRSQDGGRTWQLTGRLLHPTSGNLGIYGPWLASDGHGLLVTMSESIPWQEGGSGGTAPVRVWTTGDWGAHWHRGGLIPVGQGTLVGAVSVAPAAHGRWAGWLIRTTASGQQRIDATADTGRSLTPLPGSLPVDHVQYLGAGIGFAWGTAGGTGTPSLVLYRTTDNGRHWQRLRLVVAMPVPPLLDFADARHGWLVTGSVTWHTSDGGLSWQRS